MPGEEDSGVLLATADESVNQLTDVKPLSRVVQKKLVQARLPFKRLNPVLEEKGDISERKMPNVVQKAALVNTEYQIDDMENGYKIETGEVQPIPKIGNGWGPLDNYVRRLSKVCDLIPITIDLTEDSNSEQAEKLPSKGITYTKLANGPDIVRSLPMDHTDKDLEDGDFIKQSASTDYFIKEEVTERFSELQTMADSASLVTCTVRENVEEEDTPLSSNSSPISSPDALASTPSPIKFGSPTDRCKEKEHQLNRPKCIAKKTQRDRIREEQKIAKERAKEAAKKKKDEAREEKAKKKMEKKERDDKEKAEKLRLKEEKKKEKLEALEAKQEEKRKKEEERRIKEEEKRMKAEKAEITRFLQKSKNSDTPKTFAESCGKFAPFEIKKNMAVAPLCRVDFKAEQFEQLGKLIKEQNLKVNYLLELKTRKSRRMGRTVILKASLESDADDLQVVIETDTPLHKNITHEHVVPECRKLGKMKLLQFCENYRPAYWGTWNKSSKVVCPRRPWAQDTVLLDYEVDSDEEWEEDEPGESLSHSEGDDEDPKEEEEEEEEEEDDGFFVPHGYLSDDEGGVSDEECKNPENQKVRQRLKAKEWDELQSKGKKIHVLKPVLLGCVWLDSSKAEITFMQKFSTCVLDSLIPVEEELVQESNSRKLEDKTILIHLLPLLHGNVNGSKIIIQEFQECCRRGIVSLSDGSNTTVTESSSPNAGQQTPSSINIPSKARLKRVISESSVYEKRPDHRLCWYVHDDILKNFHQESLPVPCQWTYVTQLNPPNRDEIMTAGGQVHLTPSSGKRKSAGSMPITKFMKKATVLGSFTNMAGTEADGFQADTEEEDEDDCRIVGEQLKMDADVPMLCTMEVNLSEQPHSKPDISRGPI